MGLAEAAAVNPAPPPTHADDEDAHRARAVAFWVDRWRHADFPVLADSAAVLEGLRPREDDLDANQLGEWFSGDPLMVLKVLRWASSLRSGQPGRRVETFTGAVVMAGIGPFFRAFGPQPSIEAALASAPSALERFHALLARTALGAELALAFAVHRTDPNAAVQHAAAMLHGFAEMLLWCLEPARAGAIADAQQRDPALRSRAAQTAELGCDLASIERALIGAWRLPPLLDETTARHERPLSTVAARTVEVATRLARHLSRGWDDAGLPDDYADVATLLNVSPAVAEALVRSVASSSGRSAHSITAS